MASNIFGLFREEETKAMTAEELRLAVEAVNAKIEKAKTFKKLALELHDERFFRMADEDERMLRRLLSEYEVLRGEQRE